MDQFVYDAFISYSHRDMQWARWLQKKLEGFRIPRGIAKETERKTNLKVFRDQTDLAGAELAESLNRELNRSRYLIVICSPNSAESKWVDEEIRSFCALGRKDHIIPFIVSGEPMSDDPEQECFTPMLRGKETEELLGVNIQEIGKNRAFLKTVSVLLDVRFNRLVDRDRQRRRRTAAIFGSTAAAIALVIGGLVWQNRKVTEEKEKISFDIYAAAMASLKLDSTLQPDAIEFLRTSAESGNPDAMVYLAECLLNGWGTEPDPDEAFEWFRKGAEIGNPQCMMGLTRCYLQGIGTTVDEQLAFQWCQKAADTGSVNGINNLAGFYEHGTFVEKDEKRALELYIQAAEAGNVDAMYHVAACYHLGTGTKADQSQMLAWNKKAAEAGDAFAMQNVGLCYQFAIGTEEDPEEAYHWYLMSALKDDPDGMFELAWCIENGYGTKNAALEWYQRAADAGQNNATKAVERILSETSEETIEKSTGEKGE